MPWRNAALSGWILDPDRKKMSKSKGNVVTPIELFDQYGSDAVRYWAASARPGVDTAFSEDQMKVGRKLATKLLNVTKFVLGIGEVDPTFTPTHAVDVAMLSRLADVVDEATKAFETFDYARALERTESFFWWFCDDYAEIVKTRGYGEGDEAASARAALRRAISTLQRLFAPHIPFATEESWSWWQSDSIHSSTWPTREALLAGTATTDDYDARLDAVCAVVGLIRRTKTEAKTNQRTKVAHITVSATQGQIEHLNASLDDLVNTGSIEAIEFSVHDDAVITANIRLAESA